MSLSGTSMKTLAAGAVLLSMVLPAAAEDPSPDNGGGRYSFSKEAEGQGTGYVRLDMQTGEVALCSRKSVGMACEAAPDDRVVLENEIARLRGENAALKKELLSHGLALPPGAMPGPLAEGATSQNRLPDIRLPSDADIDRVVDFAGRVWHRLIEAVQRAQKQILDKS